MMKKFYAILAAAAVFFAAASCDKAEIHESGTGAAQSLTVRITVSDPEPGTKAVKSGWEAGDILNVYLDDATTYTPDFTLTYDGTEWNASAFDAALVARLRESGGTLRGFWEGSNSSLSSSAWVKGTGGQASRIHFPVHTYPSSPQAREGCLVADFSDVSYTYADGVLGADIRDWRFRSSFQFVVSGFGYEAGRYVLFSDALANLSFIDTRYEDNAISECQVQWGGSGTSDGRIAGIPNADGVAFTGTLSRSCTAGESLTFYLVDSVTGVTYEFTKKLSSPLSPDYSRVTSIKVPFHKFVVDMGFDSGVKWAACNLGADYLSGYGDYYAWGETEPYYAAGHAYDSPCEDWNSGKEGGYIWASYRFDSLGNGSSFTRYTGTDYATLLAEDDAAATRFGDSYRMPTLEDWEELTALSNCDGEWQENYLDTGVNGYLFTSRKTGKTSQKVFLPAAGYRDKKAFLYDGTNGYYLTASHNQEHPSYAHYGYFFSGGAGSTFYSRYDGQSVRPVYSVD